MRGRNSAVMLVVGLSLGLGIGWLLFGTQKTAQASNGDRFEDFILCTGPVAGGGARHNQGVELDGVWLLDYRTGKLLGTTVDRNTGKLLAWSEVDLVSEFNLPPRAAVHFLMTTGTVSRGTAALYLAETTTGKMAVYTMQGNMNPDGSNPTMVIRRHDLASFRKDNKAAPPAAAVKK
jgi:hypothetical protein